LLLSIAAAYRDKREEILQNGAKIIAELQKDQWSVTSLQEPGQESLEAAVQGLMPQYDREHGGFGRAPKFPPSMPLTFLLRSFQRTKRTDLLEAVEHTLQKMARGGIYDQLGGGFHRYCVDNHWLVPHFEKMLYDNALLSRVYLDTYLVTGNEFYCNVAEETLDYVIREMTSPEGGFYSSQDADSEGEEGKFFVWTPSEVEALLDEQDSGLFCQNFDISPEGNFEGKNILHVPRPLELVARLNKIEEPRLREIIERSKTQLLRAREKRIKPGRDEKILTAWNALMLRSFAEAASALDRADYLKVARNNAAFLLTKLRQDGRLLRTYRDGKAKLNAYLEDYAYLIDALVSLYESTFEARWLQEAEHLARFMVSHFWDDQGQGFYFTASDHESLISRPKDFFDNAVPSGNSAACHALMRLARIMAEPEWESYAGLILKVMTDATTKYPTTFGNLLCALDFHLARPREIAVIGNPESEETALVLREIRRRYQPNKVLACGMDQSIALLKDRPQVAGKPTVYVCENYTCKRPITDLEELTSVLDSY
jgi:uncharacterized protein YyaL (SSP411 family)